MPKTGAFISTRGNLVKRDGWRQLEDQRSTGEIKMNVEDGRTGDHTLIQLQQRLLSLAV